MQFRERTRNVHVRQSHFRDDAIDAALWKRNVFAPRAQVTPAAVAVLEAGSLNPRTLTIDAHHLPVLHVQSQTAPRVSRTASEIKNSLHEEPRREEQRTDKAIPVFEEE